MFQGSAASLLIGVVLGALGVGYITYGKRAADIPVLICGFVLVLFPMFVSSAWSLVLIGAVTAFAPRIGSNLGWW